MSAACVLQYVRALGGLIANIISFVVFSCNMSTLNEAVIRHKIQALFDRFCKFQDAIEVTRIISIIISHHLSMHDAYVLYTFMHACILIYGI